MADIPVGVMPPKETLRASLLDWSTSDPIYRVHQARYKADEFNAYPNANARFSTLIDFATNNVVPTLDAGLTLDVALMETVFHNVPYAAGLKTLSKRSYSGHNASSLLVSGRLVLIDLGSVALHRLGIEPSDLTFSSASTYPATREWARRLHDENQSTQGLIWPSRQQNTSQALMLFGDRVPAGTLQTISTMSLIEADGSSCTQILELARKMDVEIVP